MVDLVELRLDDGEVLLVEASAMGAQGDPYESEIVRVSRAETALRQASVTLQGALQRISPALQAIVAQIRDGAEAPDRVCVQFGIKVHAGAGVVVAQTATEASFTVTAEWRRRSGQTP